MTPIIHTFLDAMTASRAGAPAGIHSNSPDLERWLRQNGVEFVFEEQKAIVRVSGNCYKFCQDIVLKFPKKFTYAEGYAYVKDHPQPVHHAWVVCPDRWGLKLAFDPSWTLLNPTGREYFGKEFTAEQVKEFQARRKTNQSILLWDEDGWPVQGGRFAS